MMPLPEKVTNWLANVLRSDYQDPGRTFRDVTEVLSNYPTLSPRTDIFNFENGFSNLFLLMKGTIPVVFRGTTYNFPITCWVLYGYPREAPMFLVTPGQDMLIRPSQHVGQDGRIYHPYLAQWSKYWDKSSINDFISVLREIFAKDPPVMAKTPTASPPGQRTPPPVPPPPVEYRQSVQPTSLPPQEFRHDTPPQLPPKNDTRPISKEARSGPSQGPPLPPLPQGYANTGPQHPIQQYYDPVVRQFRHQHHHHQQSPLPPLKSQPLPGQSQTVPSSISTLPPHMRNYSHELESPVSPVQPEPPQPVRKPQVAAVSQLPYSPREPSQGQTSTFFQSTYPGAQQLGGQPQMQRPQQLQQQQQPQSHTPKSKPVPHFDLLSSPLETIIPSSKNDKIGNQAPPPIPPNPEKDALLHTLSQLLVTQTNQAISSNENAILPLQAQHSALLQAQAALYSELEQMHQLEAAIQTNERILDGAMRDAERAMQDAKGRRRPEVDELLVAQSVVGTQLYTTVAEERACEETRLALGRLLDAGRISVEVFVKQSRSLGREVYLKKALGRKIARGMGLDERKW